MSGFPNPLLFWLPWQRGWAKRYTATSKVSPNFSSEEYRWSFRIKRRGVPPSPTLWWDSCFVEYCRSELAIDVASRADVRVKFGDSRSNRSRDIGAVPFVMNKTTNGDYGNRQKCNSAFLPNKKPTNWWGDQNAAPLNFDPKLSPAAFQSFLRTSINAERK